MVASCCRLQGVSRDHASCSAGLCRWLAVALSDTAAVECSVRGGRMQEIPERAASKWAMELADGCLSLQLRLRSVMAPGVWTHQAVAVDRVR